jgi:hypothetical protein
MKTRPYLLQRLNKPYPNDSRFKSNPFAFGGGYKNGGLSDEAMEIFSSIWSYDYMGSAEFEWGALPKSWERIGNNLKEYTVHVFNVTAKFMDWRTKERTIKTAPVYIFCKNEDIKEIEEWLVKFADEEKHDYQTKEWINLGHSICTPDNKTLGWHDIDNDYLFFINKEMIDKLISALGLNIKY